MAHVRFTGAYTYTPSTARSTAIKYRAGWVGPVRRECADAAVAAGVAVKVKTPPRVATHDDR